MTEPGLRRCILVPIDLHGINRSTLETLVRIARQLDRKLLGLLLDDVRLRQVADLPFTTEINLNNGQERNLLRDQLLQHQNLISADTRRQLNELAVNHQVELSFENATGARWTSAVGREGHLDIFFPARMRWHTKLPDHRAQANCIRRLGVILANNETDTSIISTAALLSKANLVGDIYLLCKQAPLAEQLHELHRHSHSLRLQKNFSCTPQGVLALIKQSPYDLLLLPGQCLEDIPGAELEAALDKSSGQVLVIN